MGEPPIGPQEAPQGQAVGPSADRVLRDLQHDETARHVIGKRPGGVVLVIGKAIEEPGLRKVDHAAGQIDHTPEFELLGPIRLRYISQCDGLDREIAGDRFKLLFIVRVPGYRP